MTITTIDQCFSNLAAAEADVAGDFGEEMIDQAYGDIVSAVLWEVSDPDLAREFARRTLGYMPHDHVARFGEFDSLDM
jgi:hypothetical protein